MRKVLLAAVLGGSTAFAWGGVSHLVLPWHRMTLAAFRDDGPVVTAFVEQEKGHGVYVVPSYPDLVADTSPTARDEFVARAKQGPYALVFLSPAGYDAKDPKPFAIGLLLCIAVAAVSAGLLSVAVRNLPTYGSRVIFVTVLGVLLALRGPIADWNWMTYPLPYCLVNAIEVVIESLLVGLVVAGIIKPR